MILVTVIREDGTEGMTYPSDKDDVNEIKEGFLGFCKEHPMVTLGAKTAKIRRVVEMEELDEVVLPEPDLKDLMKDALEMLKTREER